MLEICLVSFSYVWCHKTRVSQFSFLFKAIMEWLQPVGNAIHYACCMHLKKCQSTNSIIPHNRLCKWYYGRMDSLQYGLTTTMAMSRTLMLCNFDTIHRRIQYIVDITRTLYLKLWRFFIQLTHVDNTHHYELWVNQTHEQN